ncbi:hypothetical protein MMC17_003475 [Xylographa soralifera]|nr:hypothetical protein [Xylographa soralifera]
MPHPGPLTTHLTHLRLPLAPLLSITTGAPHPAFPPTLLHFHLLTEAQLDELAHYYHQRTPSQSSFLYPAPVVGRWDRAADIERKRRWWGRFVGLRGCESPVGVGGEGTGHAEAEWEQEEWDRWVRERVEEGVREERAREAGGKGAW